MARIYDQERVVADSMDVGEAVVLARQLVKKTGSPHMVEEGSKEKVFLADMTGSTLVLQESREGWHRVVAAGDAVGRDYGEFLTPDETAGAKAKYDTVVFGSIQEASDEIPSKMAKLLKPVKKEIDKLGTSKKLLMMDHVSAYLLGDLKEETIEEARGKGKASEFDTDNVFAAVRRAMDMSVSVKAKMAEGSPVSITPKLARIIWNKYESLKPEQKMAYQILMGTNVKSFAQGVKSLAAGKKIAVVNELPKKRKPFMANWAGAGERSPMY